MLRESRWITTRNRNGLIHRLRTKHLKHNKKRRKENKRSINKMPTKPNNKQPTYKPMYIKTRRRRTRPRRNGYSIVHLTINITQPITFDSQFD